MKNKKVINNITNKIINKNKLNISLLENILKGDLLNIKQKRMLLLIIKREIKRINVIIEYPDYISKNTKDLLLSKLGNPNIYKFIKNDSLLGGINIKKNWEIYNLSLLGILEKIKNG